MPKHWRAHASALSSLSLPPLSLYLSFSGMAMESLLAKALMSISDLSCHPRLGALGDAKVGKTLAKELSSQIPMKMSCSVPRRIFFLGSVGLNFALLYKGSTIAEPLTQMADTETMRAGKMTSGVKFLDIVEGMGPVAHEGDLVKVNYVCRRSNGYFVHSTVDQFTGESNPIILPLDDRQIIKGLKEVLVGMKVGGKRRAVIPPNVGYTNENLKPIPDEEALEFLPVLVKGTKVDGLDHVSALPLCSPA